MVKKKQRRGAPYKITPEIQTKLVNALKGGNFIQVACDYAGIAYSTFYDWLSRGERGQREFVEFSNAVRDAMSQGEMKLVITLDKYAVGRPAKFDTQGRLIEDSITPDWKCALAMLERKFPQRWGRRDQLKLYGAENGEDFKPEGSFEKILEVIDRVEKKAQEDDSE
jgi:transposase